MLQPVALVVVVNAGDLTFSRRLRSRERPVGQQG